MSTVIIQGLRSRRLVTQGYGVYLGPPARRQPVVIALRHGRTAVKVQLDWRTIGAVHEARRIDAR